MIYLGRITIPASRSRSNINTGASVLDLGGLGGGQLNAKVRASTGGVAGDAITVARLGYTSADVGVYISRVGSALTINYKSTVSTVAQVEAAITALTGADALIAVDVPGTGATVLAAAGDFTATHLAGGAAGAFAIPSNPQSIYVLAAVGSVSYLSSPDSTSPSMFSATATNGFPLAAGQAFGENVSGYGSPVIVACWNAGGAPATVDVWAVQS